MEPMINERARLRSSRREFDEHMGQDDRERTEAAVELPNLKVTGGAAGVFSGPTKSELERLALPRFVRLQRWFGGKARRLASIRVVDWGSFPEVGRAAFFAVLEFHYDGDGLEFYFLPLMIARGAEAERLGHEPRWAIAWVSGLQEPAVLCDALVDETICRALIEAVETEQTFAMEGGTIRAESTSAYAALRGTGEALSVRVAPATSSNTLVFLGDRLLLKVFRRLEAGINPDYEIGRFLTETGRFDRLPQMAGALEYRPDDGRGPFTLAIVQERVANEGDGWEHALAELRGYYDRIAELEPPRNDGGDLLQRTQFEPPKEIAAAIGEYLDAAATLGRRTAEMHIALASDDHDRAFAPEPLSAADVDAIRQEIHEEGRQAFELLQAHLGDLPEAILPVAEDLLRWGPAALDHIETTEMNVSAAMKIRIHGDYHLGQVLWSGGDYFIIDFEGEPARPLKERRKKSSPIRDVAGMLRSYHYAAYAGLFSSAKDRTTDLGQLAAWAEIWQQWVSATFLSNYLATADGAAFLPQRRREVGELLRLSMLAKGFYELTYELNNRPDWVRIPVMGVLALLENTSNRAK